MIDISRQCACIQVTVRNENGVMVFDQSCGVEAVGHLEKMLIEAMKHERRIIESKISNEFYDRIAQLQREIQALKNAPRHGGALKSESVIDAEFVALPAPNGSYNA
jgi:hypothetical protein